MKNTQTACSFYIQDMYMKDKVFTYVHQERNFLPTRLFLTSLSAGAGRMGSSPEIDIGVSLPHAEIPFTLFPAGMVCVCR